MLTFSDVDEATIYDSGYNVNARKRQIRRRKRKKAEASLKTGENTIKKKAKPKFDKDGNPIKVQRKRIKPTDGLSEIDSALYAAFHNKTKKVCGKIVTPLELLKTSDENSTSSTNTDELIRNLVAEQTNKLKISQENQLLKHKHKHKHHKHCKKCKYKIVNEFNTTFCMILDGLSSNEHHLNKPVPSADHASVNTVIDDIIKRATIEHEEKLKQENEAAASSSHVIPVEFRGIKTPPLSFSPDTTGKCEILEIRNKRGPYGKRSPKDTNKMKGKRPPTSVQSNWIKFDSKLPVYKIPKVETNNIERIPAARGIVNVATTKPENRVKNPPAPSSTVQRSSYETAFLSFLQQNTFEPPDESYIEPIVKKSEPTPKPLGKSLLNKALENSTRNANAKSTSLVSLLVQKSRAQTLPSNSTSLSKTDNRNSKTKNGSFVKKKENRSAPMPPPIVQKAVPVEPPPCKIIQPPVVAADVPLQSDANLKVEVKSDPVDDVTNKEVMLQIQETPPILEPVETNNLQYTYVQTVPMPQNVQIVQQIPTNLYNIQTPNVYQIVQTPTVYNVQNIYQPVQNNVQIMQLNSNQIATPQPEVKPPKRSMIWMNQKYYTVNTCATQETEKEKFYPMSHVPIILNKRLPKKPNVKTENKEPKQTKTVDLKHQALMQVLKRFCTLQATRDTKNKDVRIKNLSKLISTLPKICENISRKLDSNCKLQEKYTKKKEKENSPKIIVENSHDYGYNLSSLAAKYDDYKSIKSEDANVLEVRSNLNDGQLVRKKTPNKFGELKANFNQMLFNVGRIPAIYDHVIKKITDEVETCKEKGNDRIIKCNEDRHISISKVIKSNIAQRTSPELRVIGNDADVKSVNLSSISKQICEEYFKAGSIKGLDVSKSGNEGAVANPSTYLTQRFKEITPLMIKIVLRDCMEEFPSLMHSKVVRLKVEPTENDFSFLLEEDFKSDSIGGNSYSEFNRTVSLFFNNWHGLYYFCIFKSALLKTLCN